MQIIIYFPDKIFMDLSEIFKRNLVAHLKFHSNSIRSWPNNTEN